MNSTIPKVISWSVSRCGSVAGRARAIATATAPRIQTVDVVGRPIADNNLCQNGTLCVATGEDRRLGDFFTNAVDERGCVLVATGDTTQKDPVTGGERPTALPLFVRQTSGTRLVGAGDCSAR